MPPNGNNWMWLSCYFQASKRLTALRKAGHRLLRLIGICSQLFQGVFLLATFYFSTQTHFQRIILRPWRYQAVCACMRGRKCLPVMWLFFPSLICLSLVVFVLPGLLTICARGCTSREVAELPSNITGGLCFGPQPVLLHSLLPNTLEELCPLLDLGSWIHRCTFPS